MDDESKAPIGYRGEQFSVRNYKQLGKELTGGAPMRVPESQVGYNDILLADSIETSIGPDLYEWDGKSEFSVAIPVEGLGVHSAEVWVHASREMVEVMVWMYLCDLLSLTGPRASPRPHVTELGEHGEEYQNYRNRVLWTVTSELGLKSGLSLRDALYGSDDPRVESESDDVVGLICGDYDGSNDMFGPSLNKRAPFSVGFRTEAFWELDSLSGA